MEVFMIQPNEARKLCSTPEWELVEKSFSPIVERLAPSDLKSRLERARKLYRKSAELVSLQRPESRKRITRRKHSMFAEAVDRFRATLNLAETAVSLQPASKSVDRKATEKAWILNRDALQNRDDQKFSNRRSETLSALIDHGQQQMSKSGARAVQGHVAAANRRQQRRRDTKNR
jgi:hypothetical protein